MARCTPCSAARAAVALKASQRELRDARGGPNEAAAQTGVAFALLRPAKTLAGKADVALWDRDELIAAIARADSDEPGGQRAA
jgi:hypothetical protein